MPGGCGLLFIRICSVQSIEVTRFEYHVYIYIYIYIVYNSFASHLQLCKRDVHEVGIVLWQSTTHLQVICKIANELQMSYTLHVRITYITYNTNVHMDCKWYVLCTHAYIDHHLSYNSIARLQMNCTRVIHTIYARIRTANLNTLDAYITYLACQIGFALRCPELRYRNAHSRLWWRRIQAMQNFLCLRCLDGARVRQDHKAWLVPVPIWACEHLVAAPVVYHRSHISCIWKTDMTLCIWNTYTYTSSLYTEVCIRVELE